MTPEARAQKALDQTDRLYDRDWLIPAIAAAIREAEQVAYARGVVEAHEECAQIAERLAVQFGNSRMFGEVVACANVAEKIRQRKDNAK